MTAGDSAARTDTRTPSLAMDTGTSPEHSAGGFHAHPHLTVFPDMAGSYFGRSVATMMTP